MDSQEPGGRGGVSLTISGAVIVTNFSPEKGFLHYKTRGANKNEESSYLLFHGFAH